MKAFTSVAALFLVLTTVRAGADSINPLGVMPVQPSAARTLQRTETLNFDNWIVVCQEFADAPNKRSCHAQLQAQLQAQQPNSNQLALVWTLSFDDKKQLNGTVHTMTGVMIAPGVELQLENKSLRKFVIESCEPSYCTARLTLDDAFVRDATASAKATVNLHAVKGNTVQFDFPIKGFDKAYARLKENTK